MAFKTSTTALSGSRLRARALDLLSRRDHSEVELKRKLLERGGCDEEVSLLLRNLKASGYLDDFRFTENYLRSRQGKLWGFLRFRKELAAKGVASEIIESVLQNWLESNEPERSARLRSLVEREFRKGRSEKAIASSLLGRGFFSHEVRPFLEEFRSLSDPD